MGAKRKVQPLFEEPDWSFERLSAAFDAIEDVALNDLGLDVYPNQIEIISSEQMLDAYSSLGMPLMYPHWSFGKRFAREEKMYRKGYTGLAYEIVINSNPCISYVMEENTMALQTLVMAHAAFGHNHFFKNNYLFRQWTDADGVLDYFQYAKAFIATCEEKAGMEAVEETLDAAHALMDQAVFRYRRPRELTSRELKARAQEAQDYKDRTFSDLWRTVPQLHGGAQETELEKELAERMRQHKLPEENVLFFIERNSPVLEPWQREVLRIVRTIAQYFYPQRQTKVMNEGCATFVHHYIANELYDRGLLTEGTMLEILHSHANVVFQADFDDPRYSGLNPYALGFSMMQDIKRMCMDPTAEDKEWFPEIAGNGDWRGTLKDAWANYRDESFILQYLSPRLIREFKLFALTDDADDSHLMVSGIHDEDGYRQVREMLARGYDPGVIDPDIQVIDVDLKRDRQLHLRHAMRKGIPLAEKSRDEVLKHARRLWGYDVSMVCVDADSGAERGRVSTADWSDDEGDDD